MTEEHIEQNRPTLDALWKQYENAHYDVWAEMLGTNMGFHVAPPPEEIISDYELPSDVMVELGENEFVKLLDKRYHAAKVYMMARNGDMNGAMIYKLENC